jgi:hypothetical protein
MLTGMAQKVGMASIGCVVIDGYQLLLVTNCIA